METNLYTITIPPMIKALDGLSKVLDKVKEAAKEKATDWRPAGIMEAAFLSDKIVFDQFDLKKQIQVATDNAKGGAARLAEIEIPVYEDNEQTVAELKARIQKTIDFVKSIKPEQVIGKEGIKVTLPYFPGKYFTGFEYVTGYLIPNFYFHVTTAYSIVRKNGIDIGKADYMNGQNLNDL
jgi:hypothetical protein